MNGQGRSDEARLVLVVDGVMGPWAEFGACSKTCTPANQTPGEGEGVALICQGARSGPGSASRRGMAAFPALEPCTVDSNLKGPKQVSQLYTQGH